ncbi:sugar porter family MFS transporter [Acidisoma cellulosilytica]|uniref:Sugar porter family MFS transporter n=1 Tax=Acidisoma cellulosilyticum TaxID=2802395 RepID=A0A963Z112_9PROT|nr:sugar porter family MFS transporter [Acidisoma cellulosilyticum]MCB8880744.1 sugar porter family MFS transporter [Acidisoma cellulosilyticum]
MTVQIAPDRIDAVSTTRKHKINISPSAQRTLGLTAVVAAVCGGLYGYDTGIISGALLLITRDFHLSSTQQEMVASAILLGAVIGALATGWVSERIGRRPTMTIVSGVFVIGALACAFAPDVTALIVARIFLGLAVGGSTQVVPMYISELAPQDKRGRMVTTFNIAIGFGILLANIIGLFGRDAWGWRVMVGLAAAPAFFVFCASFLLPRSPRWAAENLGIHRAMDELARVRTSEKAVRREAKHIQEAAEWVKPQNRGWRGLGQPWVRPALVAALGVAFFTQCGGLEMMIYYAPTFLRQANFGDSSALLASLGVAITYCIVTILGSRIVDRVGRRRLMLILEPASALSLIGLGVTFLMHPAAGSIGAYMTVVFLILFMIFNSGGIQICGWLLGSEMFPLSMRGQATALHAATLWGADLLVTGTALSLVQWISLGGTMWVYAGVNIAAALFVMAFVPETSGASLEDIEAALHDGTFKPTRGRTVIATAAD